MLIGISAVPGRRVTFSTVSNHGLPSLNGKTPAKPDDLKKGLRVVITGKSEKDILKAGLIDVGSEK